MAALLNRWAEADPGREGRAGARGKCRPGAGFDEIDLSDLFGGREGGGFADLFKQFSGGGGGTRRASRGGARAQPRRGADLSHTLEVPFATAVSGGKASLRVQRAGGKIETIDVKIPAGIESGKKIRLRGQGEPSPAGGEAGDILITVKVAPHPHFRREGHNLEVRVPITLAEAALGAKVDVPTPKGTVTVTVPKGTSSGKKLRIKGHGVTSGGTTGDLLAEVQIVLPENLSEEDLESIKKLTANDGQDPRQDLRW